MRKAMQWFKSKKAAHAHAARINKLYGFRASTFQKGKRYAVINPRAAGMTRLGKRGSVMKDAAGLMGMAIAGGMTLGLIEKLGK